MTRKGFTLIELLVVVAVLALLASIVFSNLGGAREGAKISNALSFQSQTHSLLGSDLVGWWSFDEGSGCTASDISGYGNNGTLSPNCPSDSPNWTDGVPGTMGSALEFDGVDDYVNIGTGNDYFPLPSFTVCSWVKSPGLAPGMTRNGIVSITYGLIIRLDNSGRIQTVLDDGSNLVSSTVSGNLHDDTFHNLCLAFDGTNRIMFVDGENRNQTATTWLGTTRWPTNSANIGHDNNNPPFYKFNGLIDDVRIYSRALTASEVQGLYAQTKGKYLAND